MAGTVFCHLHQNCEGSPLTGDEPAYVPDRYNANPLVRDTHNCWSYGMDVVDPTLLTQCAGKKLATCDPLYHQPGGVNGLTRILDFADKRTCPTMDRLIRSDVPEIRRTTFKARCPRGSSKIAMVMHPGEDYHFFRQDADGWWSHKDGANPVKRYDAEHLPVWNPKTAARDYRPVGSFLNYRDFCGFYCVPRRKTVKLARGDNIGNERI